MAVKFKLKRVGSKKKPTYRVILIDESRSPSSREIEIVGEYNPRKEPAVFNINKDRILHWIETGAVPTDRLRILLGKAGILPPIDLTKLPKRKSKQKQKAEGEPKTEEKPKAEEKSAVEEKPKEKPKSEEKPKEEKAPEEPKDEPKPEATAEKKEA